MKKETYLCNLCREEYTKEQATQSGMKEYYCTRQYLTRYPDVPTHEYELRDMHGACDTHICGQCITNLKISLTHTKPQV